MAAWSIEDRKLLRDGKPLLTLGIVPDESTRWAIPPHEADALIRRIADCLNYDEDEDRATRELIPPEDEPSEPLADRAVRLLTGAGPHSFTFDVKAFVTVHVQAEDEASARQIVDDRLPGLLEGGSVIIPDSADSLTVNSASLDGEHDLLEVDEEAEPRSAVTRLVLDERDWKALACIIAEMAERGGTAESCTARAEPGDVSVESVNTLLRKVFAPALRGGLREVLAGFTPPTAPTTTTPQWKQAFPDYPLEDMPQLPEGFADVSWRNDTCPSFQNGAYIIWVDYRDPAMRDIAETDRFSICLCDRTGANVLDEPLLSTSEWDLVLRRVTKPTAEELTHELTSWCATQDLEPHSADEMAVDTSLSIEQRVWLSDYVKRWEAAESDPAFWNASEDEDEGYPPKCSNPGGHSWVVQEGDEITGEGRSYCEWCGADGDA